MEPSRGKSLCVPFDSAEPYVTRVAAPESFRQHLAEVFGQHPELLKGLIRQRDGLAEHCCKGLPGHRGAHLAQSAPVRALHLWP